MVGMQCVCIDDKFPIEISKYYVALPKEGSVYTVRNLVVGINLQGEEGEIAVYLKELINPKSNKGPERGFKESRFRPLQTLEEFLASQKPEEKRKSNKKENQKDKELVLVDE